MARSYRRDARGRFAGGGGGSGGRKGAKLPAPAARKVGSAPQRRRGLLIQRAAVKSTKAKLAAKDPADRTIKGQLSRRSQKGAVTKASRALQAAQQGGRVRLSGRSGVIRPGKGGARKAPVKAPSRRSVRSESQQANRDNMAKLIKSLPKQSRRSVLRSMTAQKTEARRMKGVRTTYKAQGIMANTHQANALASSLRKLPMAQREPKLQRMRARVDARRRQLFNR